MQLPLAGEDRFPAHQARWMVEMLGAVPPRETLTTCDACVQIPPPGVAPTEDQFDPRTRCCTYLPTLHNHLVGAILEDSSPEGAAGRATVEARIDAGAGVLPIGLWAPEEFRERYKGGKGFGRDLALRCPHYQPESGRCGVWRFREAACSTWFCRFDRGDASHAFWRAGLGNALRAGEHLLAQWAVVHLGAGTEEWGRWEGDPRGLYRAAHRLVSRYSWSQVEVLGGEELKALAEEARSLYRALLAAPQTTHGRIALRPEG